MKKKDILFGKNSIIEALKSGVTIEQILISKTSYGEEINRIFELAKASDVPVRKVPIEKINYLLYPFYGNTDKVSHQGVVATTSSFEYSKVEDIYFQKIDQGKNPVFVLLDRITDVRNFGAISRNAVCFDIDAIIIPTRNSVSVNADAIKTSSGALNMIPICRADDTIETINYLLDCGFQILGATEKSSKPMKNIDWTLPTLIVLGNENSGMSYQILEKLTDTITIEMNKEAFDSLNVSVSAGILFHSVYCHRNQLI